MNDPENPARPEPGEGAEERATGAQPDAGGPDAGGPDVGESVPGLSAHGAGADDSGPDASAEEAPDVAAPGAADDGTPGAADDEARSAADDGTPDAADGETSEAPVEDGPTSLYVRRGRTPTLAFWVALAIVLPALAALLSAPLFDFADMSGVLNFMLVAAVFVGLPLAAIAALVDSLMHRRETPRGR